MMCVYLEEEEKNEKDIEVEVKEIISFTPTHHQNILYSLV